MTERDLNFEVNNSIDLNRMLTGVLMDVRRGNVPYEMAKAITMVADKINRNNVNTIEYRKLRGSGETIEFFENENV